ncbi:MAG: peptide deformylase [Dehalococcoidia bacterium]|jgi:peptide deformylase
MAVLKIRTNPDPVLRKKAKRVKDIDSVQRLIDDMVETLNAAPGVGLAANQVGTALRIIVIRVPEEEDVLALINPEIVEKQGERCVMEGCLSIPGYQAEITRSESVKVRARDRHGKLVRKKATELLAQALEHEIDHLNGILYIDYLQDKDELLKTDEETE